METQTNLYDAAIINSGEGRGISEKSETLTINGVRVRTANKCVEAGASIPDPVDLYDGLWYQGELCALYADTNIGKSILAVQIAEEVANKGFKVMYVDLELSDKGFELRSRHDGQDVHHLFPESLYRVTVDFRKIMEDNNGIDDNGFDVLDRIEALAITEKFDAVIIDNITALCSGMESGDIAVKLVNRLLQMKTNSGLSVLFIAHTPKLDRSQPITRDSMGGSKRVISLIDSAFAIGQSLNEPALRYIKQTKVRVTECKYHENNVKVCRIEKVDGLLKFIEIGCRRESDLLTKSYSEKELLKRQVLELKGRGHTVADICRMLSKSRMQVRHILEKHSIEQAKCENSSIQTIPTLEL